MASRAGGLIQDQNFKVHFNGETVLGKAEFTGQRKVGGAGGRKPLGDLSNSGKPSFNQAAGRNPLAGSLNSGKPFVNQASKQMKSKNFTIVSEEPVAAKVKNFRSNRTASKGSEKSETVSRKALSDISNSGKLHVQDTKKKNSLKLSALAEEPIHPSATAEERCLHNHRECIKSHSKAMDMDQFLKMIGLESDSADHLAFSLELPGTSKLKLGNHLELSELKDIPEIPEVQSPWKEPSLSPQRGSSSALCKTPKLSSGYNTIWEDSDVNFKLINTPE